MANISSACRRWLLQNGQDVDNLIIYVHWLMIALFVGWIIYFFYAVNRFRRSRNPKADYVGVTNHASSVR